MIEQHAAAMKIKEFCLPAELPLKAGGQDCHGLKAIEEVQQGGPPISSPQV
jgi:hypothetical protein